MSLSPLDLVSAHPWQRVAFTTYALSLSFFEAVILDALVRGGGSSQPLILADVRGVSESLSEQGAHRVGKDYDVEPVAVRGGVFHPKITVLASGDECHVLVGSGNLTFNGWGGNCEVIEHLHAGFASDAIADVADFFELLPASERIRQGAGDQCLATATVLRRAVQGRRPRNGDVRLLHNLQASLTDQIASAASELGGAQRLVVAAPFWDSGAALEHLCRSLAINEASIHAHAKGTVEGTLGANWPRHAAVAVHAVRAAPMDSATERERPLHAKVFEILCRRGRLIVSGSANGTRAGLDQGGNVEACVLRVEREPAVGWSLAPAERPETHGWFDSADDKGVNRAGVLRAVLEGDEVIGQVLTPNMNGSVQVYHLAAIGPELIGETQLDAQGKFRFAAPGLERWSWRGGRLVIRVTHGDGRRAEGFVSVASFAEIARRGGLVTRRLFAVIFGNETPEDVNAIMSWLLEDPRRLLMGTGAIHGGGDAKVGEDSEQLIPVAALHGQFVQGLTTAATGGSGQRHWSRFLDQVMAAFREPRGPFGGTGTGATGDDEDDETTSDHGRQGEKNPAVDKTFGSFAQLFAILTKDGSPERHCEVAFDLTGFICARLRPDLEQAREWLDRVLRVWLAAGVRPDRRDDVAATILTVLGTMPEAGRYRWARSCLRRLGVDLSASPPSTDAVQNYQTVFLQQQSVTESWAKLQSVRTFHEQVRAYLGALDRGQPTPEDYPELPLQAREAWPVLADAFRSPAVKASLLFTDNDSQTCPRCHISLPQQEAQRLQTVGIAIAKSCCRRVVIKRES